MKRTTNLAIAQGVVRSCRWNIIKRLEVRFAHLSFFRHSTILEVGVDADSRACRRCGQCGVLVAT